MKLVDLLAQYRPGSFGADWTWDDEYAYLNGEVLNDGTDDSGWAKLRKDYQENLVRDIRVNGIAEPVCLGNDGRVWDGHHRVCAAIQLDIDEVPVEL